MLQRETFLSTTSLFVRLDFVPAFFMTLRTKIDEIRMILGENINLQTKTYFQMSMHQVDRLGVNRWRLREVKYENSKVFIGPKKNQQIRRCELQAHVVCRMLGFTGARRAFIGCRCIWQFPISARCNNTENLFIQHCIQISADLVMFSDLAAAPTILQWLELVAVVRSALLQTAGVKIEFQFFVFFCGFTYIWYIWYLHQLL